MTALLTIEEAAAALKISRRSLYALTASRGIAFTKLGRRCYFEESDLQAYRASRRVEPKAREAQA